VIQGAEALELHHRDGHHQDNRSVNLVFLHPNCHRQVHSAPGSKTGSPRSLRGAGHACAACRETGPLRSEGAGWARAHLATRCAPGTALRAMPGAHRDREGPHGLPPPTPPDIRVTYPAVRQMISG
jgi:hypothetical protein